MNPRHVIEARTTVVTSIASGVACLLSALASTAAAQPTAVQPYTVSLFAASPAGVSQPDSIVQWHDHVVVGFQNHVAKDGSDGKSSTIVDFSLGGAVTRSFQVPGHNDGLRIVDRNLLWALQNEDANPNLVVIDLRSGMQTQYQFPPTPHGGGYDDIAVRHGSVYLTASNPNLDANGVNDFPALVRATLSGNSVALEPVLYGNGPATDFASGKTTNLNLTDPDSMTVDPRGNLVFVSQADSVLVFVHHPLEGDQAAGVLALSSSVTGPGGATITIDDTAFAPRHARSLLVTDVAGGAIYKIERPARPAFGLKAGFESGQAYCASDTLGLVGTLDLDTGFITPIATAIGSARGLLFLSPDDDGSDGQDLDDGN
jgi:hypothetical protein